MKLTKKECLEALDGLVKDHKTASKTVRNKCIIEQLIEEYFESHKLSYNELDFIIECVKPYEKELGLDVEILVSKLKSMKDEAKEKVEKVFIWD